MAGLQSELNRKKRCKMQSAWRGKVIFKIIPLITLGYHLGREWYGLCTTLGTSGCEYQFGANEMKDLSKTALLLIGFQNDYFAKDGILHAVVEESSRVTGVLENTLQLLSRRGDDFGLVVSTPIHFTPDYEELSDPVGILKTIKEVGAFKSGARGSETIQELAPYSELIKEVPGKRGLNAFSNTELESLLKARDIEELVLAGTVTSICIDSTGRHAAELGFKVTILSDCTSGRTVFEQDFYCDNVFPLYGDVARSEALIAA